VKKTLPAGKRSPVTQPQRKVKSAAVAKSKGGKSAQRSRLGWRWPTKGQVVQEFARGDPLRKGVKVGGRIGQPVLAAEAGKVVYAGSGLIGYGRLIIIKHNKNYLSAYGHNRKLLVREGDTVSRGQQVAEVGKNGSGRAMLHFEIRRNGAPVDPLKLLPRRR
jgi:lipoprotein NlpD